MIATERERSQLGQMAKRHAAAFLAVYGKMNIPASNPRARLLRRVLPALFAAAMALAPSLLAENLREIRNINQDWKFSLGDRSGAEMPRYDDSTWDPVGLPHSFSIPYFRSKDFYVGYGWYRKTLDVPREWHSKSIFLEFDGVFQEAEIFLNGAKTAAHVGGYTGFSVDITNAVRPGTNILSVRVNNLWNPRVAPRAGEHVFSGGIYRNVRLVATDRLHVAWYGTSVTTPKVSAESATVRVKTEVVNDSSEIKACTVRTDILDSAGERICGIESAMEVAANAVATFDQISQPIAHPKLWHPDHPNLYSVRTTVLDSGKPVDSFTSPLGFRWFEWTADRGFFLNGEHYYFHGANVHQDHAGWGDAVTDAGAWRDVKAVKDAGFDFIRGSHYPHSPGFSEACDRVGVLFWSENCFWGTGGHKPDGYWNSSAYPVRTEDEKPFEESVKASLRDMIRIHRNHPSIVVWSMSNEPFFSAKETMPKVRELLKTLVALSHELDPTRPAAIGGCQRGEIHKLGDIAGLNGDGARLAEYLNPGVASVISEYGSTMSDRPGDYTAGWGDLPGAPGQEKGSPYPWRFPWRSGEAIWCAFDHGSIAGSKFGGMGLLDYFRLPKRQWFWYRNEYRKIPPPAWPVAGVSAGLRLTADKTTLKNADGTDDAQIVVTVVDANGKALSNCVPVTLSVESGPGEFPTGPSIRFTPNSDIDIRDGQAAIEFRSLYAGVSVIKATSPGLGCATIQITTGGTPAFIAGQTPPARQRPYVRFVRSSGVSKAEEVTQFGRENPTRASSEVPGHSAPLANDGIKGTYWQSSDDQSSAWWQVDLERIVTIAQARMRFANADWHPYRIEVSENGVSWKRVVERQQSSNSKTDQIDTVPPGTTGRFLRITFTGISPGHPAALSEIQVPGSLSVK